MSIMTIGPYQLGRKLGHHSRHQVYEAIHQETKERFAVKLVNITSKVDHDFAVKRLKLEAKILQRLSHPHLVQVFDAGMIENQIYYVMEYVEGETLGSMIARRGKLPWDVAIEYARQLAEVLSYLHSEDLLHLKLTPEKILITYDGQVKVTDMRVNRARKRRWDEAKRRDLDTAAYMSPEHLAGEDSTEKSDIYSLGVILFEMIGGKLPFEPDTLARMIQRKKHLNSPHLVTYAMDCPVWVDKMVAQMVAGSPAMRPHSAQTVLLSLNEVQKMAKDLTSATEKLASGFSPLTAGKDKTKAKQILGREDVEEREPRDYSLPALVGGLFLTIVLLFAGLIYAVWPLSEETMIVRARLAVADEGRFELLEAKTKYLQPLIEKYPKGKYVEEAKELLDTVETRLALQRMILNHRLARPAKSEGEKLNVAAFAREEDEDYEKAYDLYSAAMTKIPSDGDDRGHYLLSKQKIGEMKAKLVADPKAKERVQAIIATVEKLLSEKNEVDAEKLIDRLLAIYSESAELAELLLPIAQKKAEMNEKRKLAADELAAKKEAEAAASAGSEKPNQETDSIAPGQPNSGDRNNGGSAKPENATPENPVQPTEQAPSKSPSNS